VGLAACGSSGTVSASRIEKQLVANILSQRPGLKVVATCPSGVKVKVGAKFGCGVVLAGDPVNYTITITAVAGSDYESDATPTQPIIDTDSVVLTVQKQEGAGAAVTCGPQRFVQLPVNTKFSCQVTKAGHTTALSLVVSDTQGDVTVGGAGGPATTVPAVGGSLPGE
jgi:hypothetical protein